MLYEEKALRMVGISAYSLRHSKRTLRTITQSPLQKWGTRCTKLRDMGGLVECQLVRGSILVGLILSELDNVIRQQG